MFAGCKEEQPEQVIQQPLMDEVAAAHILITHSESETDFTPSGRTRAEAENLSLHLSVLCTLAGRDFGELAKQYSEDPSTKTTDHTKLNRSNKMTPEARSYLPKKKASGRERERYNYIKHTQ